LLDPLLEEAADGQQERPEIGGRQASEVAHRDVALEDAGVVHHRHA
jgi:hypothetical protein